MREPIANVCRSFHFSLQDFYLLPARHIADLCTLLAWFESDTPQDHPDRRDLRLALDTLQQLHRQVEEVSRSLTVFSFTAVQVGSN